MIAHRVQLAHTADLSREELAAVRDFIFAVFDDVEEEDWDHCLGGVHAVLWEGDEIVATGSVVQRQLFHGGRVFRTGYVEGVAVRADRQRHGLGSAVMSELERIVGGAYDLGALASTDAGLPFYEARGWRRWRGATYAATPEGLVRTPDDDDAVFVWPLATPVDIAGDLVCDFRAGHYW